MYRSVAPRGGWAIPSIHSLGRRTDTGRGPAHNVDVTAIAWSLVGLMAASLGVLASALFSGIGRLDGRIEALSSSLAGRIDAQGAEVRADIREVRQGLASLDQRLTRAGG